MKKSEDISIGRRIRDIRLGKNKFNTKYDQASFAKLIGSTVSALSNWENGRNKPNSYMLKKIAELGDISVDELLYGEFKSFCNTIFNEVDNELIRKFDLFKDEKYKSFFSNSFEEKEKTYGQIKKIGIGYLPDYIKDFYYYRLVNDLPFEKNDKDREIYNHLTQKLDGYESKDSIFFDEQRDEERKNSYIVNNILHITEILKGISNEPLDNNNLPYIATLNRFAFNTILVDEDGVEHEINAPPSTTDLIKTDAVINYFNYKSEDNKKI